MKEFEWNLDAKNNINKISFKISGNTKLLREEINFSKVAILDFEAISSLFSKNLTKKDFFENAKGSAGIPISASLLLSKDGNLDEIKHFEILSKTSIRNGPKLYKDKLKVMLNRLIGSIPIDYKIIVWGKEFEKEIFSYMVNQLGHLDREKQLTSIFDLQKIFNVKTQEANNKNYNVSLFLNFKNKKNVVFKNEEKKLKRELDELSSFSYEDCNLKDFSAKIKNEEIPKMRGGRSLDFVSTTISLIKNKKNVFDIDLFEYDRKLFIKINSFFARGRIPENFLPKLKEYNNEDVKGIFLIFNWLSKTVEDLL